MNLVIDIGNTRSKIASFNSDVIVEKWVEEEISCSFAQRLIQQHHNPNIIISTVGKPLSDELTLFLEEYSKILWLNHRTSLPIKNAYQTPKTLGLDRLAGVIGGQFFFEKTNLLVIDAGTCITYDFLSDKGVYHGGAIAPGLSMRYKSLNNFTAKLPLLNKQRLNTFVGYTTETSIQAGVFGGLLFEIQGFIQEYSTNFGQIKVIMTGGDAQDLASQLKNEIFVHPDLVLIGLNKILQHNVKSFE